MTVFPPTQKAITGGEDLGDRSRPEQALAEFYSAFNGRDLARMAENWAQSADVVMDNPVGGIRRGWAEIGSIYERIFSGSVQVRVEFFDYTVRLSRWRSSHALPQGAHLADSIVQTRGSESIGEGII